VLASDALFADSELSLVEQQVLLRKHAVSLSLIKFDKIWLFSPSAALSREAPFREKGCLRELVLSRNASKPLSAAAGTRFSLSGLTAIGEPWLVLVILGQGSSEAPDSGEAILRSRGRPKLPATAGQGAVA